MKKKILLITNSSSTIINFRKDLIFFLDKNGFDVYVITGDNLSNAKIADFPIKLFVVPYSNRSLNPFKMLAVKNKFRQIIKKIQPDIVFTFQLKPNILGVQAAKECKINKIYAMVEGLGDPFQPNNFLGQIIKKIVSFLYKITCKNSTKVFVLNHDDFNFFINEKLCVEDKLIHIPGIGIDCDSISPTYYVGSKKVLMMSRLIKNKGILDFCKIARETRKIDPSITFHLYGSEAEITKKSILDYINDGSIYYHGVTANPISVYNECDIFLLPTHYREGLPKTLLEAMACGKPCITYNVPGCKDIINNNTNGFLVEKGDYLKIVDIILNLFQNNHLCETIGINSRKILENRFSSKIINAKILKEIN